MSDVTEAIRRLLEGSPIAPSPTQTAIDLRLVLAELDRLQVENTAVKRAFTNIQSGYVPLLRENAELKTLTDPCTHWRCIDGMKGAPVNDDGSWQKRPCSGCGGVGRVARNQPETELLQVFAPEGMGLVAPERQWKSTSTWHWVQLMIVKGSGSWEKEGTSNE